jgi:hypothetical protein
MDKLPVKYVLDQSVISFYTDPFTIPPNQYEVNSQTGTFPKTVCVANSDGSLSFSKDPNATPVKFRFDLNTSTTNPNDPNCFRLYRLDSNQYMFYNSNWYNIYTNGVSGQTSGPNDEFFVFIGDLSDGSPALNLGQFYSQFANVMIGIRPFTSDLPLCTMSINWGTFVQGDIVLPIKTTCVNVSRISDPFCGYFSSSGKATSCEYRNLKIKIETPSPVYQRYLQMTDPDNWNQLAMCCFSGSYANDPSARTVCGLSSLNLVVNQDGSLSGNCGGEANSEGLVYKFCSQGLGDQTSTAPGSATGISPYNVCQEYCLSDLGDCDKILTQYCNNNPSASDDICGCFRQQEFDNYKSSLQQQAPQLYSLITKNVPRSDLPDCYFPPCESAFTKGFGHFDMKKASCGDEVICANVLDINTSGQIQANINAQQANNCAAVVSNSPQDCLIGWSDWSGCSEPCGGGTQTRSGRVAKLASGGKECPNNAQVGDTVTDSQGCNTQSCTPNPPTPPSPNNTPVDCQVSCGTWSDCSGGVQEQDCVIVTQPSGSGKACPPLVNKRNCNNPPTPTPPSPTPSTPSSSSGWPTWLIVIISIGGFIVLAVLLYAAFS